MAYLDEYSLSWWAGEQIRDKSDNTLQNNSNSDSRRVDHVLGKLGQPYSLGQHALWLQLISDSLDIWHACLYTTRVFPRIFLKFADYICGHNINLQVFSVELS